MERMPANPAFGAFQQRGRVRVIAMTATVVALCPCGTAAPIVTPVLPGQRVSSTCMGCGSSIRVESISYYEPKIERDAEGNIDHAKTPAPQLTVAFDIQAPKSARIVVPTLVMP